MIRSIEELRLTSDNELVKEHDKKAANTSVGTNYYTDELDRRSRDRNQQATYNLSLATQKLAQRTYVQSWVSVSASVIALAISVISLSN